MSAPKRVSHSAGRAIRVMLALKGHSLTGLSNGELAQVTGESPATINRCLNTLIEEGVVIKLDSGRFALGTKILQMARAHENEMSRAQTRLDELNQRVLAGAR
jgi:DNA-binding IclR family transcriptional regulator